MIVVGFEFALFESPLDARSIIVVEIPLLVCVIALLDYFHSDSCHPDQTNIAICFPISICLSQTSGTSLATKLEYYLFVICTIHLQIFSHSELDVLGKTNKARKKLGIIASISGAVRNDYLGL